MDPYCSCAWDRPVAIEWIDSWHVAVCRSCGLQVDVRTRGPSIEPATFNTEDASDQLLIRLPPSLKADLRAAARIADTTMTQLVIDAIESHLEIMETT